MSLESRVRLSRELSGSPDALRAAFKSLRTAFDVARMLEVPYDRLAWLCWKSPVDKRYARFAIRKRRGGTRPIAAPTSGLAILQSKLASVLDAVYVPRDAVHGYVPRRGVRTNARPHVRAAFVLNVDLKDFFPSIHFGRVRALFMKWPYDLPGPVATTIAQVCFAGHEGLPQGAPTSPVVSNILCATLDSRLRHLASTHRCTYSRYADDITFSTTRRHFPAALASLDGASTLLGTALLTEFDTAGFAVNPAKVRLRARGQRQEVTGVIVNTRLNVPRRFIRQVRAMLHALRKHGPELAATEFRERWDKKHRRPGGSPADFVRVVAGKIAYVGHIRGLGDPLYERLVRKARTVSPRFGQLRIMSDAVLSIERDVAAVLLDSVECYGSAFATADFGLVTAAHVVHHRGVALRHLNVGHQGNAVGPRELHLPILSDASVDIAVCPLPGPGLSALPLGDPNSLHVGDEVLIWGYPANTVPRTLHRMSARITGETSPGGRRRYVVDQTIHPGYSGGPVLNAAGEVVGIAVTGSYGDGTVPNAFTPISEVVRLANEWPILDLATRTRYRRRDAETTDTVPN